MEEIWKDIKGFEGKYKVSNTGKILSLNYKNTGRQGIIQPIKNKDGYLVVKLYSDRRHTKTVHKLVAQAFIKQPQLEINHLDGNKENNNIENLEWCTHAENERYSWKTLGKQGKGGRKKEKIRCKQTTKAVVQYDLYDNYIKRWKSATEAGKELHIRSNKISACCNKKRNKAGGYKWRFAN